MADRGVQLSSFMIPAKAEALSMLPLPESPQQGSCSRDKVVYESVSRGHLGKAVKVQGSLTYRPICHIFRLLFSAYAC